MEGLSLIDVSAEDDLLFDLATPPPAQAPPRHPDPTHAGSLVGAEAAPYLAPAAGSPAAADRAADLNGVMEEQAAPERTESPKQRKAKTGVNLRKSLAWDSAFFTSEGVLDTEELEIVNSTFRKTQRSRLPEIVEEMRKSGDSTTSTVDNDWAVESLETEVFDNVRASIQRSLGKPNKVPGGLAGSSKPPKATANVPRIAARKGVDRIPQTKTRAPVSTSQGVCGVKQRSQVNSKESAPARVNLPGAAEAKTSSKPPRALPRVAMMRSSTNTAITSATIDKRNSTGGAVNRQAASKTANTKASVLPSGGTKSISNLKSGAFTSTTASSYGVSTVTGPELKTRTTLSNKNRTAQRVPVRSSSKSDISKTVPTRSSGNKIAARGHADRASPIISPSSSVDSMSSVISGASTASTVGRMSHTSESLNTLSPSLRKSNDCPPTPKLRPRIVTEGDSARGDSSKSAADLTNQGKGFKPTGLRRPKPKIGYFDAEKSVEQNIGAQVQLQPMKIQCLLPATPKSQPPIHKENDSSKSEPMEALPLNVVQMKVEPFKVAEPEGCTVQIDPVIAEPEAEKSMNMQCLQEESKPEACTVQTDLVVAEPEAEKSMKMQCLQEESKPVAAPHEEISACKSTATKAVPLKAVQMEVDPLKVAEPEVCLHKTNPVVQMEVDPLKVAEPEVCLHKTNPVVQMEVDPLKVAEPEVCLHKTNPVVAADTPKENIPAVHQNIKAVPLKAVQMEADPLKVAEPEACLHKTNPVVAADTPKEIILAVHHNIKAVPLKAVQIEADPLKVAEPEACLHKTNPVVAADTPKENIPVVHQNIKANVDASALVDLLTQKLSSISLGEATSDLSS